MGYRLKSENSDGSTTEKIRWLKYETQKFPWNKLKNM